MQYTIPIKEVNLMKKAQGLTLNTIIIAALVLLVLVILALIFTGRIQIFGTESASCVTQGGSCEDLCGEGQTPFNAGRCSDEQVCCIRTELATR